MNFQFIDEACESYFVNQDLHRFLGWDKAEEIRTEISDELKSFMRDLRENDIELYEQIYDQSRMQQRKIINYYLEGVFEDEYSSVLQEGIVETGILIGVASLVGIMSSIFSSKKLGRATMKTLEKITDFFDGIAKFLITNRNRNLKFRAAIIRKNAEECYKKECNVDPDDLGIGSHMKVTHSPDDPPKSFSERTAVCLRDCYLERLVDMIALLFETYFACLKRTGEFDKLEQAKTSNDLVKIVTGTSLSRHCESYFDKIKESFDNFHELLDFLFPQNRRTKGYWRDQLRDKLLEKKNQIQKQENPEVAKRR